jgi:hypothetical protein
MKLGQAAESWCCGLVQNLGVFKADADFTSDCNKHLQLSLRLKKGVARTGRPLSYSGKMAGSFINR